MAKVKDYNGWNVLRLNDRAILKSDYQYMAKWQTEKLDNMEVILVENNGKTLILSAQNE